MKSPLILTALSFLLVINQGWAENLPDPSVCTGNTPPQSVKALTLPDSVWQAVKSGKSQRLLAGIDVTDLSNLSRPQQIAAYDHRKQRILQSLPEQGASALRQFDQLPLFEIEVRSEQALRRLLAHCWVSEIYPDREESPLPSRSGP
jgi:hypothetical protein